MTDDRYDQIAARMQEMMCTRAAEPIEPGIGWAPNEDGTFTHWQLGPGPSLVEGVTLRADADPGDFDQLRIFLET